ncbi:MULTISPECIES: hypothetical protein [unclassified Novosphingobium]|uniref:hypothetical protein n=1 Tax=unclassified Novosphingobium TaxID=2644732 RepID=UPI00146A2351|nr:MULTISPECIES: hypothetical protein [unclassified Novosphingobium]NMN03288.1 general secretion pathway protein L [Novosphingobium sp. SG919]NMN86722.1 general secretion pathway protein L [Novosphingobium sp. SG916]
MPDAGLILLLPENGGPPCAAWRVADGVAQPLSPGEALPAMPGCVTALVPSGAVPVLVQPLEATATPAQTLALARLAAQDGALAAGSEAVAALSEGQALIALVDPVRRAAWQQAVSVATGQVADALVPAALVLPPPAPGTVHCATLGGVDLARTATAAFVAEPPLWQALLPADDRVVRCDASVLAERLAQGHAQPWIDLADHAAHRAPWPMRRLARLAALVGVLALAVPVAQIARWRTDSARIVATAVAQVRTRHADVADLAGAERAVRIDRMQQQAGADGWAPPTAALWQALRAAPAVRLAALAHQEDGALRFTLAAGDAPAIDAVLLALQRDGWRVAQPPVPVRDGAGIVATVTMRAP